VFRDGLLRLTLAPRVLGLGHAGDAPLRILDADPAGRALFQHFQLGARLLAAGLGLLAGLGRLIPLGRLAFTGGLQLLGVALQTLCALLAGRAGTVCRHSFRALPRWRDLPIMDLAAGIHPAIDFRRLGGGAGEQQCQEQGMAHDRQCRALAGRAVMIWVTACGACLLAAGCSEAPVALLDDYQQRVARVTAQPLPPAVRYDTPAYPRPRERSVPAPEVRVRLLELFDFEFCDLSQLIAERNSILDRYAPASRRLDYEWRFAHRLGRCREWLGQDRDPARDELRARLDEIAAIKHEALGPAWWATTYGSAEFERHLSLATPPLPPGVPAAPLAALDALLALESGQASPPDGLDLPALEAQLQQLGASAWGGAWLHAAVALGTTLDGTAALLEQAAARPYCRQGRPTPEARILQTVFWKFYAGRVQPYLSQVHRQGEAWLQRHAALLASQRVTPPPAW
jgi:hypothetical protein